MKKLLSLLLAFCACLVFVACDDEKTVETPNPSAHTHEYATVWSKNETHHWYACTGEDCTEMKDKSEHTLANGVCSACGYESTSVQPSKAELYKTVCDNIVAKMSNLGGSASPTIAPLSVSMDDAYEVANDYLSYMQVKGVSQYILWVGKMMQSDSFRITDDPVQFTYSYQGTQVREEGVARLMYKFDEENDKVYMYWDVDAVNIFDGGSNPIHIFLYLGIDYNFDTNVVGDFDILTEQSMGSNMTMLMSFLYRGTTLKMLKQQADPSALALVQERVNELKGVMSAKQDSLIDLQADFTQEYTEMMNEMNPPM